MSENEERFLAEAGRFARLATMAYKLRNLLIESEEDEYIETGEVLDAIYWLRDEETQSSLGLLGDIAKKVRAGR